MQSAPIPPNDKKRVESLRRLQLLDSPIEDRFERITRMACRTLDMPIVAFTLVDDDRQTFKSVQGMEGNDMPRDLCMCGHVIAGDGVMVVNDTKTDQRFFDNPIINSLPSIGFYAGCPVRAPDGEKIGTLCAIDTRAREMSTEQIQNLQDMAAMVETELRANMLSKAQTELLEELNTAQRSSLIDPLTRLWNRNGISDLVKREWDIAIEHDMPLAIVMADIDHFKKINDTYGHPVGDEVLKFVAHQMLNKLRSDDIIGRMGGEEFLLILPKCQSTHLSPAMERLRHFFETTPVPTAAGDIALTISFGGVSAMPSKTKSTADDFIKLADDALYTAKRSGRNRIEITEL